MVQSRAFVSRLATAIAFIGMQQLAVEPAEGVKRRAFVSSATGSGNLNSWADSGGLFGLAAGDNICRELAGDAGLPNAGTYVAWLSSAATDAYCHVQGQTGKKATGCVGTATPAGPWYRYDGVGRFAGTIDELVSDEPRIYQPIRYTETGGDLANNVLGYWTGSDPRGEVTDDTCGSWVVGTSGPFGLAGSQVHTTGNWTYRSTVPCEQNRRLLCLEPGLSEVTPVPWVPAALAFTTSAAGRGNLGSWPEAAGESGLEAGDAICRNLASAAHLPSPETFIAWISSSTVDAADRMTLDGVTIRRVDGFRIADSKADLLANGNANTFHVDERGRYLADNFLVYTSTYSDGTRRAEETCLDWTSSSGVESALFGTANIAYGGDWTHDFSGNCSAEVRLLCFSTREILFWDGFDLSQNTERWSATAP